MPRHVHTPNTRSQNHSSVSRSLSFAVLSSHWVNNFCWLHMIPKLVRLVSSLVKWICGKQTFSLMRINNLTWASFRNWCILPQYRQDPRQSRSQNSNCVQMRNPQHQPRRLMTWIPNVLIPSSESEHSRRCQNIVDCDENSQWQLSSRVTLNATWRPHMCPG